MRRVTAGAERGTGARRRWRVLLALAAISIGWKVLVFTIGAALPRWVVEDGVSEQPIERRAYAARAKEVAAALWSGPIERRGLIRGVRVLSVDSLPGEPATADCGGLAARVRAYTYFALPYSEVRTLCDSGYVVYRVFRGRGHGRR